MGVLGALESKLQVLMVDTSGFASVPPGEEEDVVPFGGSLD